MTTEAIRGREAMSTPPLRIEGISGQGPRKDKPASSQRYREYAEHPADVIYWSKVVLPRFKQTADRQLQGQPVLEKQRFVAELAQTYHIVEAYPNNLLEQQRQLRNAGISDERVLDHVAGMMPDFQAQKERIFAETEGRSYRKNKRKARKAEKEVKRTIGKDETALLPETPGLPLEMVTNLAALDSMIGIFTQDAYDQHPELKNKKGKRKKELNPKKRAQNKEIISEHVTGLLTAYIVSESYDAQTLPDFSADYMSRFTKLKPRIEEKKVELEEETSKWTSAQQRRHVLSARRHFNSFSDTISLKEQTGLSEEMVADIKKERLHEYGKSALWAGAIEGSQIGVGWALGAGTADLFELKNLAAVAILAGAGRAVTSGLLYEKQRLSGAFYDKFGYAPDPATKWAGDRFGKPKLGFALSHWPFEGLYGASTFTAMSVLGAIPGLATEIAADALAIPRQVVEVITMKMAIEGVKGSRTKWVIKKATSKPRTFIEGKARKQEPIRDNVVQLPEPTVMQPGVPVELQHLQKSS